MEKEGWKIIIAGVILTISIPAGWAVGWWQATSTSLASPISPISPLEEPVPPLHRTYLPLVMWAELPATKKGVANTYGACGVVQAVGARYQYGWGPMPADCGHEIEDIPMVWGPDYWAGIKTGQYVIGGDSSCLLGPNECDLTGQCNATPCQIAVLWRELEAWLPEHAPQITCLVSPAPSHLHPEWLDQSRACYVALYGEAPQIDRIAVHCYGNFEFCKAQIQAAIAKCNAWPGCQSVWLTEFANFDDWSARKGIAQLGPLVAWMEAEPMLERYFIFTSLIKNDGSEWWWYDGYIAPMTPALAVCTEWQGGKCLSFELSEFGWWYMIAHTWEF